MSTPQISEIEIPPSSHMYMQCVQSMRLSLRAVRGSSCLVWLAPHPWGVWPSLWFIPPLTTRDSTGENTRMTDRANCLTSLCTCAPWGAIFNLHLYIQCTCIYMCNYAYVKGGTRTIHQLSPENQDWGSNPGPSHC